MQYCCFHQRRCEVCLRGYPRSVREKEVPVKRGQRSPPVAAKSLRHTVSLCRARTAHRAERGPEQAAGISEGSHRRGEVPDRSLVAHLSRRVRDQDGRSTGSVAKVRGPRLEADSDRNRVPSPPGQCRLLTLRVLSKRGQKHSSHESSYSADSR